MASMICVIAFYDNIFCYYLICRGIVCGLANIGGSVCQQIGLVTVSAGKTAFITGMFVIFVPITEWILPCMHGTITLRSWLAAAVSVAGLYLLSGCAEAEICFGDAIGRGEIIVFVSMLFWVVSILGSDAGAKSVDAVWLTIIDFSVTTIVTFFLAWYFEPAMWIYPYELIVSNWRNILAIGASEGFAFALSTQGQKYTPPSRASLLYSCEAVATAIFSYFFINEVLTHIEVLGCALMTVATFISSLDESDEVENNDEEVNSAAGNRDIAAAGDNGRFSNSAAENDKIYNIPRSFGSVEMKSASLA